MPVDSHQFVLITGADSGIGRATVSRLAEAGFSVLAACYGATHIWDLSAQAHERVRTVRLDVTSAESCAALAAQVGSLVADRGLYALVNSAGIALGGPQEVVDLDVWQRQLDVNVLGTVRVTQSMLPALRRAKHARIVNIGSICGLVSFPFVGPYCVSKHGIDALTMALRGELRPWEIQATVVAPGLVNSPLWQNIERQTIQQIDTYGEEHRARYGERVRRRLRRTLDNARQGLSPDAVARVVEHVLQQRWLKPRYLVGTDARLAYLADRLLPRRRWCRRLRHWCGLPS